MAFMRKLLFAAVAVIPILCLRTVNGKALKRCHLRPDPGLCYGNLLRYYYEPATGKCQPFIYGGCRGNANNFRFLESCSDKCVPKTRDICQLPKVVGPCRAGMPRFYYNTKSGKCEQFTYGGCDGNANNFLTKRKCDLACPGYHVVYKGRVGRH